jgi:hypothetical protein
MRVKSGDGAWREARLKGIHRREIFADIHLENGDHGGFEGRNGQESDLSVQLCQTDF